MKVLVTGSRGQLGWELVRAFQPVGEVTGVDLDTVDLSDPDVARALVRRERPTIILNAAAYTAVDRAESDEASARLVNAELPRVLAEEARDAGALLVHYSTDYVYPGTGDRPFVEAAATGPVNAYGRTKLEGDRAIEAVGGQWLVFRTSWVFADRGGNFVRTMLRLGAERDILRVVDDQVGAPTPARLIADVTSQAIARSADALAAGRFESGLYHLCPKGETSWRGFAEAILAGARRRGLPVATRTVEGIASHQYPTPARRPLNSRLATAALQRRFGLTLPEWTSGLDLVLDSLAERTGAGR